MCAAILLKRQLKNEKILILEALDRVGKKLIVTGNGRCNITNRNIDINSYHGQSCEFCYPALSQFGSDFTEKFFDRIGIPFIDGENGKVYPYSLQASSVVDALRLELDELGIEVKTGICASKINTGENCHKIIADNEELTAKNIIVATGGVAGGKKLGSFGIGYKLLESLGHTVINPVASLVQLKTDIVPIKSLCGIKLNATVTLYNNGVKQRSETDELLFTRYGISGPAVLQVSRGCDLAGEKFVKINFMPEFAFNEIVQTLKNRVAALKSRSAEFFFTGLLPKMLGHALLKKCNIKLTDSVSTLSEKHCRALAQSIYSFELKVCGTNGMENAQVTAGGVSTNEFDNITMESLKCKGVFAIGEVLDIDGDCGGFNLQWAWSSAAAAAQGIIGKEK